VARLTTACSRRPSQSSNLHPQICRLSGPRLMLAVRRMPNVGSIFRVEEDNDRARYFWCVGTDASQLNSALIVVFQRSYGRSAEPDLSAIVTDDVDFYCHVFLLAGKKQRLWQKVGFRKVDRQFPMVFRCSDDYGDPSVLVSKRWYVWRPNEPYQSVWPLRGDLKNAELGMVMPPECVVARIRTGKYGIKHPTYDESLRPCA
jgi:hypothetical protein